MSSETSPDSCEPVNSESRVARMLVQQATEAGRFDRTLVYRLLPGGDREVIAETRDPAAPCLLGLRLPASGFAPPALEFTLKIHGRPYGALCCYGEVPRGDFGQIVAAAVAALEPVLKPAPPPRPLPIPESGTLLHTLLTADPGLPDLAGADGVAVIAPSGIAACGLTPEPALLHRLAALTLARPGRVLATDCLTALEPDAAACRDSAAGMLAVALGEQPAVVLAAFRRETAFETIRDGDFAPVTVPGHCRPWEPEILESWRTLPGQLGTSAGRLITDMATFTLPRQLDGFSPAALLLKREGAGAEPRVLACNRDFRRLFGLGADETIGRPPPIEIPLPGTVAELPVPVPGGAARTVLVTHRPLLRLADGKIDHAVSVLIFEDVSRSRRAEQALHSAHARADVAARTNSAFLAGLSHGLRTPLNTIIGFSEIMRAELFGPLGNPKYREYARNIQTAGEQLLSIIGDGLDVSKIDAGHYVLEEQELDLTATLEEVCRQESKRAERAGVKLLLEVAARRMPIRADGRALKHIVLNLLSNSFKFTPSGGLVVCRTLIPAAGGVAIEIQDTGVGMPEDHLHRVLASLLQGRDRPLRKTTGAGLGLPLVRALAELHGGHVIVNSRAGHGTAIRVCLPPRSC